MGFFSILKLDIRGRGGGRGGDKPGNYVPGDKRGKYQGGKEGKHTQVVWANASLSTPDLTMYTIPAIIYTLQHNSGRVTTRQH